MSFNVSMLVNRRDALSASALSFTVMGKPAGSLMLTGDDGETVQITVGSPDYCQAIADFINELNPVGGKTETQLRASLRLVTAAE